MRLTPRKPEVKHVVAAIDRDHPSADAAAKAAIKAVSEVLDFREWFVIAESDGAGDALLWGVFSSEKEAAKALAKMQAMGAMDGARIYSVRPVARPLARLADKPLDGDCECEHPKYMHQMDGSSYGKCGLSACKCKKFKESGHPTPEHPTCLTCKQPIP